jgi:hypothetical protein
MNRIIAAAVLVVLATVLAGCASKSKKEDSPKLPSASDMFDKKVAPMGSKGAGPG